MDKNPNFILILHMSCDSDRLDNLWLQTLYELWIFLNILIKQKILQKWIILSVSESGSAPEIWYLSVGRTDTVYTNFTYL